MQKGLVNQPQGSSTLVEHLLHHPKIKGSSSVSAAATRREKSSKTVK